MYKRWKERSHMHISRHGDENDADGHTRGGTGPKGGPVRKLSGRKRKGGHLPNANAKDELRGVEEIRKHRQKKALREKFGSGGGGGGKGKGRSGKAGPSSHVLKDKRGPSKSSSGKKQSTFRGNGSSKKGGRSL